MVYYRKYRPQTISDLDSASLRETLHAVLSGNTVAHAFLFTGPKGLGKTSTARIVAKVVNCEHPNNQEPDNTCEQCVSITNGTNIDVLEIDGASNRGIDEIRDLREKVVLAPSGAKKKVYIIDEVHMLTTEAFNALLKTIEEPPAHVMFIFCTTEPQKVPATIFSRCFHLSFHVATEEEIVHSLQRIVRGEQLTVEDGALHCIAKMSQGGFRDGAKMLEEIVSLAGTNAVTEQFVEEKYHVTSLALFATELVTCLSHNDAKKAIAVVKKVTNSGLSMQYFLEEVLNQLHAMLLENVGVTSEKTSTGSLLSLAAIGQLASLLSDTYAQTKFAVIPQLPLEMAIVLWCQNPENVSVAHVSDAPQKTTMETLLKKQQTIKIKTLLAGKKPEDKKPSQMGPTREQSVIGKRPDELTALYENIIYKVKPRNQSVAGVLRGSKITAITDEAVLFETAYTFHKERLEEQKTCEIIEQAIKEVTGKPLKMSVVIKNKGGE